MKIGISFIVEQEHVEQVQMYMFRKCETTLFSIVHSKHVYSGICNLTEEEQNNLIDYWGLKVLFTPLSD